MAGEREGKGSDRGGGTVRGKGKGKGKEEVQKGERKRDGKEKKAHSHILPPAVGGVIEEAVYRNRKRERVGGQEKAKGRRVKGRVKAVG